MLLLSPLFSVLEKRKIHVDFRSRHAGTISGAVAFSHLREKNWSPYQSYPWGTWSRHSPPVLWPWSLRETQPPRLRIVASALLNPTVYPKKHCSKEDRTRVSGSVAWQANHCNTATPYFDREGRKMSACESFQHRRLRYREPLGIFL